MKRLVIAMALLAASLPLQAQTYKCVDASGKVSYSDKRRPGCEPVRGAARAPAAKAAQPAAKTPSQGRFGAPKSAAPKPASPQLTRDQQARRCQGLRQERAWLASGRAAAVPGREERLGQVEAALRGCP